MIEKLIAPIIVTAVLVLVFFGYALVCAILPLPAFLKLIGLLIPLSLLGVSVYVLLERIKEIRSGEEDDLSKY